LSGGFRGEFLRSIFFFFSSQNRRRRRRRQTFIGAALRFLVVIRICSLCSDNKHDIFLTSV
jgi:hypothetical protein